MNIIDKNYSHPHILNRFFPLFILAVVVSSQYYYDLKRSERPLIPLTAIPAQILKFSDLGLHSATASLMWIYTVQQMATAHPGKIPELIMTVNELDPKFGYPYAFAALILPPIGFKDEAIRIATKGVLEADKDWRIPYYLATTYHIFFEDRKNAILYFDMAARTPGSPEEVKIVASRYGTSKTVREQTKEIWTSIYKTSDNDIVKERASRYLLHIELLEVIEKAVIIYRKKYGFLPREIRDLVQPGILREIPESPLGFTFYLDENGRVITK